MKYKLEVSNRKGILIAKFETTSKTIFDTIVRMLNEENLVEADQDSSQEVTDQ